MCKYCEWRVCSLWKYKTLCLCERLNHRIETFAITITAVVFCMQSRSCSHHHLSVELLTLPAREQNERDLNGNVKLICKRSYVLTASNCTQISHESNNAQLQIWRRNASHHVWGRLREQSADLSPYEAGNTRVLCPEDRKWTRLTAKYFAC
jgi:hypothetical protein